MQQVKKLLLSFKYAIAGVLRTIARERNMRIHLVFTVYMFSILGLTDWFVITKTQWAILFLTCGAVIGGELINTAVENAVNLATREQNELAKIAKDAAAGAVLVTAIFAVLTGFAIMFQKEAFQKMFDYFKGHTVSLVIFILSIILAFAFIFLGVPFVKTEKKDEEK